MGFLVGHGSAMFGLARCGFMWFGLARVSRLC